MQPEQSENRTQKTIASFIVILAIVIVTVGVSALNNKKNNMVANTTPTTTTATTANTTTTPVSSTTSSTAGNFKDGTYSANSSYETPGGQEGIAVSITVQNGAVANASVQNQSNNRESQAYQSSFVQEYKSFVIGKKLSDISVSSVSGSSLTAAGFDQALSQIKSKAQTS